MRQDVIGINEQAIEKLILDVYDYADRINNILNAMDDVVQGTTSYFNDDSSNNFRHKFEQLKINFPIVNHNIQTYGEDLVRLKNNYFNTVSDVTQIVKKQTANNPMEDIEIL